MPKVGGSYTKDGEGKVSQVRAPTATQVREKRPAAQKTAAAPTPKLSDGGPKTKSEKTSSNKS